MSVMYVYHLLYPLYCLLYVELIWYLDSTQKYDEILTKFEHNSNSPLLLHPTHQSQTIPALNPHLSHQVSLSLTEPSGNLSTCLLQFYLSLNLTHHYCLQYLYQCLQTQRKHSLLVNCLQINPISGLYCVWHKVQQEFWPAPQVNMQVAKSKSGICTWAHQRFAQWHCGLMNDKD